MQLCVFETDFAQHFSYRLYLSRFGIKSFDSVSLCKGFYGFSLVYQLLGAIRTPEIPPHLLHFPANSKQNNCFASNPQRKINHQRPHATQDNFSSHLTDLHVETCSVCLSAPLLFILAHIWNTVMCDHMADHVIFSSRKIKKKVKGGTPLLAVYPSLVLY